MLSSSNLGQSGPHAHHAGFGSQLSSLAGFTHLTGYPDGSPQILYGPYIDYIAVAYGAVAILGGLGLQAAHGQRQSHRHGPVRDGSTILGADSIGLQGQWYSRRPQCEPRSPCIAHGAYPCKGDDSWCALSVHSESEWKALCRVMGGPGWTADREILFARITQGQRRRAGSSNRRVDHRFHGSASDGETSISGRQSGNRQHHERGYSDPQLAQRPQWVELEHPEIGKMHYQRPPFLLTKTPPGPSRRDPLLAEHNEYFYRDLLGLSEPEYNQLVEAEVIY